MAEQRVIVHGIAAAVRETAAHAQSAVLVAPFITRGGIEMVLGALPARGSLTVFTRWRASEVAAGVSDPTILGALRARGGHVFLKDDLHAKVYVFDDVIAFVGSANLTESGLGVREPCNIEAVVSVQPPPTAIFMFLRALAVTSTEATEDDAKRILDSAKEISAAPRVEDVQIIRHPNCRSLPFPQLRAPGRLFDLYTSLGSALTRDEREQALDDLNHLETPEGMSARAFTEFVRARLETQPQIVALNGFLGSRKRFGEITDWLMAAGPYSSHRACQRHAQTLIRWLLHFLPDRYRLGQPHYSEVLERVGS